MRVIHVGVRVAPVRSALSHANHENHAYKVLYNNNNNNNACTLLEPALRFLQVDSNYMLTYQECHHLSSSNHAVLGSSVSERWFAERQGGA